MVKELPSEILELISPEDMEWFFEFVCTHLLEVEKLSKEELFTLYGKEHIRYMKLLVRYLVLKKHSEQILGSPIDTSYPLAPFVGLELPRTTIKKKQEFFTKVRKDGTKKRQKNSKENFETIEGAIEQLYADGKGWMSYKEITAFLIKEKLSPYEYSYTQKLLKKIVPPIKKKYKSGQLSAKKG